MIGKGRKRVRMLLFVAVLVAVAGAVLHHVYRNRQNTESSGQSGLTNDPHAILAEANHFAFLSNSYEAEPLYVRAEQMFRERGDKRNELYAKIGRIRAQAETMSFVDISNFLASQLTTPLVQNDPELKLWCLTAKGMTDNEINVPAAKKDWEEAEALAGVLKDKQWETRSKGELGLIGFLEGDSWKAGRLVGGALLSAMATGDIGAQIRYLELIGNGLEVQRRPEDAQYFFDRAISLANSCKDCGFPYMAYEGRGEALAELGRTDEARAALTKCLNAARHEQRQGHEAQTLILLGRLSIRTGNVAEAVGELEAAAATSERLNYYRMEGDVLFELAKVYEQQGDYSKAEARLITARKASMQVGDRYNLPRDLTALARLEVRRGKIQEAENLYDEAEDVIDSIVMNAPGPYSGGSFLGEASETYLGDFGLAAQTNNVNRAFRALERARGRTIEDALQGRRKLSHEDSPAYDQAEGAISAVQLRLMRSENPDERRKLLEDLEEQEQRLAYLNDVTIPRTPFRSWQPPELRDVQTSLTPGEMVLEYVLEEPRSFCLSISHNEVRITKLDAGRQQIEELTRSYLSRVRDQMPASDLAKQLYSVLLGPIPALAGITHLIIVPDGKLYFLPFDALEDRNDQYLIKSTTVTYVPSTSVREILKTRKPSRLPTRAFLGVGDVAYDTSRSASLSGRFLRGLYDLAGVHLGNLPGTREEVITAERALGGRGSVLLLGANATTAAVKGEPLADFSVLHLAVHSIPSTQYPTRAALVLARKPSSNEDGLFQEWQIIGLSLNADLVTLSACDTGVGRVEGEEGVTDLADAFLFAGAKSVVASLWESDDQYTDALMQRFYQHLSKRENKDVALREAKTDLLREYGADVAPFYWAGFVLVGEGSSPVTIP